MIGYIALACILGYSLYWAYKLTTIFKRKKKADTLSLSDIKEVMRILDIRPGTPGSDLFLYGEAITGVDSDGNEFRVDPRDVSVRIPLEGTEIVIHHDGNQPEGRIQLEGTGTMNWQNLMRTIERIYDKKAKPEDTKKNVEWEQRWRHKR